MTPNSVLALAAAMFSAALAVAAACRKQRSLATWCFSVGMLTFALESLFGAIANDALLPQRAAFWETLTLVAKSFLPGVWLAFSLTYSRANYRGFPPSIALASCGGFFGSAVVACGYLQTFLRHCRLQAAR